MSEYDRLFEMLRIALAEGDKEDFLCAYLHDRLRSESVDPAAFKSDLLRCAASAFGSSFDSASGTAYLDGRRLPAFKAAANSAGALRVEAARPRPACEPASKKRPAAPLQPEFDPARCPDPFKAYRKALAGGRFGLAAAIIPHIPENPIGTPAGGAATALAKACARRGQGAAFDGLGAAMDACLARGWRLEAIEDGHRFPSEYLFEPVASALARIDKESSYGWEPRLSFLDGPLAAAAAYFSALDERGERPIGEAFGATLFDCAFLALASGLPASGAFVQLCRKHRNMGSSASAGPIVRACLEASGGAARSFAEEMQLDELLVEIPAQPKRRTLKA